MGWIKAKEFIIIALWRLLLKEINKVHCLFLWFVYGVITKLEIKPKILFDLLNNFLVFERTWALGALLALDFNIAFSFFFNTLSSC